ncbi:MAG: hypothetical protein AAB437_05420 [Patescibacteria group bacterium]
MGVDIFLKAGKKEFGCRLYWLTNLIEDYHWRFNKSLPSLFSEKKLNQQETKQLIDFLEFSLVNLIKDKGKQLKKFSSNYFKKIIEIKKKLSILIGLIKNKENIDSKLRGLTRRLEYFTETYGVDPYEQRKEIILEFDEKIVLVKKLIEMLKKIIKKNGEIVIG